jgi:hypothetical protein
MEIKHIVHHADNSISLRKQDIIETNRLLNESMNLTTDYSLIIPKSRLQSLIDDIDRVCSVKKLIEIISLFTIIFVGTY